MIAISLDFLEAKIFISQYPRLLLKQYEKFFLHEKDDYDNTLKEAANGKIDAITRTQGCISFIWVQNMNNKNTILHEIVHACFHIVDHIEQKITADCEIMPRMIAYVFCEFETQNTKLLAPQKPRKNLR